MARKYERVGGGTYGVYRPQKADQDWVGWVVLVIIVIGVLALAG